MVSVNPNMEVTPDSERFIEVAVFKLRRKPGSAESAICALITKVHWPHPRGSYVDEALSEGSSHYWVDYIGLDGVDDDLIHHH